MLSTNPLIKLELDYLRQNKPHQKRHYFLLALALIVASFPLFYLFTRVDEFLVQALAFVILSVYWFIQWLIMRAAVVSANHELPDEMLGNYSKREILDAKLKAILLHYRGFIVLVSLAGLGLSMAMIGYVERLPTGHRSATDMSENLQGIVLSSQDKHPMYRSELGLLHYISNPAVSNWIDFEFYILLAHPLQIARGFIVFSSLTISNSILTASFGLFLRRIWLSGLLRFGLIFLMIAAFLALFSIRDTSLNPDMYRNERRCNAGTLDANSYFCRDIGFQHFLARILDSLQSATIAFSEGGVSITNTLLCPHGYNELHVTGEPGYSSLSTRMGTRFNLYPFEWRQIGIAVVTVLSQLSLSAFLLWRARHGMGKKK